MKVCAVLSDAEHGRCRGRVDAVHLVFVCWGMVVSTGGVDQQLLSAACPLVVVSDFVLQQGVGNENIP